ncbi:MAG: M14 family zinc carboxypeptidase, partial [Gammaproteobacteria bacterium]|nr:M14 family zinc carboxypeptidase [Gammaproteobacteria bacterium]
MRKIAALFGLSLVFSSPVFAETGSTSLSGSDVCRMIAGKLGSVSLADCLEMDMQLTSGASVNNVPILQKEYPPLNRRKPQARVLLLGGIHGDEYSSVSIVFKWMKKLNQFHSGLFHWRVIPLLNPDGLLQKKSQRMNANGVDLNRNFPTPNWEYESTRYWIDRTKKNPRRYPGKAPLSEPESRWFAQEIESFQPHAIVSVHAPHGILDFDGPPKPP